MGGLIVTVECIVSDASRTREERTAIVRMIDEFLPIYRNPEINIEKAYKKPLFIPESRIYILISQRFKDLVKIYKLFA